MPYTASKTQHMQFSLQNYSFFSNKRNFNNSLDTLY